MSLAKRLSETLPSVLPDLFHPWVSRCPHEAGSGASRRLAHLERHLDCEARMVLVGEACGYQGCRYSGIPFTSERLLLEGAIPRITPLEARLSVRKLPFSEPSATIVWKTLFQLGLADQTVLWNALPLHPHRADNPWSNRTPTDHELNLGAEALELVIRHYPGAAIVAVGRKAELALRRLGIIAHSAVRHPANGGASAFATGLKEISKTL
ncbi:MAG: hypothetical protein FIA97_02855 [Methylococcaceae bacterium]|nr:hypothetical protein [Methylococcaceae bacterium]